MRPSFNNPRIKRGRGFSLREGGKKRGKKKPRPVESLFGRAKERKKRGPLSKKGKRTNLYFLGKVSSSPFARKKRRKQLS